MFNHLDRLDALQDNIIRPIVMHIMPTSTCNLNCSYCSVKNRPKEELKLEDIKSTVRLAKENGLKSVILSGGGEPTLYPQYDELIKFLQEEELEIGLITNGTTLINKDLTPYTWIRVSINPETIDTLKLPNIPKSVTLGFSYIVCTDNYSIVRTDINKLDRLVEIFMPKYVRLLADCTLAVEQIHKINNVINTCIKKSFFTPVYMQQIKLPEPPKNCYLGYLHPVLYCDGYIYPCDSCVLNDVENQKFHDKYRICHHTEYDNFLTKKVKSLVCPKEDCPNCVFTKQNEILDTILNTTEVHKNFI